MYFVSRKKRGSKYHYKKWNSPNYEWKKRYSKNGVVVIKDNKIISVGNEELLNRYSANKIIDAEDGIIMPGMINTHTHVAMTVFRSLADDVPDRLNRYIFPLGK